MRRSWPRPTPQAQKMIDDARESAAHVAERKQQEAVAAAEQIMAKAREASAIEHERTMTELKRELGRLVVEHDRESDRQSSDPGRSEASCRKKRRARSPPKRAAAMKINKETRQLSKELLRASFTDGQLDSGRDRVPR